MQPAQTRKSVKSASLRRLLQTDLRRSTLSRERLLLQIADLLLGRWLAWAMIAVPDLLSTCCVLDAARQGREVLACRLQVLDRRRTRIPAFPGLLCSRMPGDSAARHTRQSLVIDD